MCEFNELLSLVTLSRDTIQEACIDYCGKSSTCKYYQFEQDSCPRLQELKRGLLVEILKG